MVPAPAMMPAAASAAQSFDETFDFLLCMTASETIQTSCDGGMFAALP
ncbi:exported hypothetical protein [Thiomonas arsenitoxydans]|uniref:Uncharacterized protein n=1 Tax=Thiomonas arsenitoxydans (strain DSM 22701 / CIP 110005 / 3As) TaxID=426114 RepID=A0ABM9T309_THIA3|nr:exported hypothetical protein [Thiomonas arsenitoxydans]